jgi:O-antigen ligase
MSRRRPGRLLIASGLLLAVCAAPLAFSHELYDNFTLPKQAALLVAAAAALLGCALERRFLPRHRLLRIAFALWLASLLVSWLFGLDRLGSVLGYYQYRQGLLTQVSYAVLFAASLQAAGWLPFRVLAWPGIASLAIVATYAGIQTSGHDWFGWWTDASSRAISTIGNANELAAYAVIGLAFSAAASARCRRWGFAVEAGVAGGSGFIVLSTQSRSGLLALAIVVCTFALSARLARWPRRLVVMHTATLAAAILGGLFIAAAVGRDSSSTAGRVETGISHSDPAGSTRVQLWRGTLATFEASPLIGFGPDALYKAFPVHRPADLHGAFDSYDLVVQSSHNWLLDTAANGGVFGLAALGSVLAISLVVGARRAPAAGGPAATRSADPFIWSAMAGYLALTLVNPISLAPQAIFFVLLGRAAGANERAESEAFASRFSPAVRFALAAPLALALATVAILLPVADISAQSAWEKYAHGQFVAAAHDAESAAELMPLEQTYTRRAASSWLAEGATGNQDALRRAELSFERIDRDFGMTSLDATALATARIGLREPPNAVNQAVDRVRELNPHGVFVGWYTSLLRRAASSGGVLRYSSKDDWVRVDANGDVALP